MHVLLFALLLRYDCYHHHHHDLDRIIQIESEKHISLGNKRTKRKRVGEINFCESKEYNPEMDTVINNIIIYLFNRYQWETEEQKDEKRRSQSPDGPWKSGWWDVGEVGGGFNNNIITIRVFLWHYPISHSFAILPPLLAKDEERPPGVILVILLLLFCARSYRCLFGLNLFLLDGGTDCNICNRELMDYRDRKSGRDEITKDSTEVQKIKSNNRRPWKRANRGQMDINTG